MNDTKIIIKTVGLLSIATVWLFCSLRLGILALEMSVEELISYGLVWVLATGTILIIIEQDKKQSN